MTFPTFVPTIPIQCFALDAIEKSAPVSGRRLDAVTWFRSQEDECDDRNATSSGSRVDIVVVFRGWVAAGMFGLFIRLDVARQCIDRVHCGIESTRWPMSSLVPETFGCGYW